MPSRPASPSPRALVAVEPGPSFPHASSPLLLCLYPSLPAQIRAVARHFDLRSVQGLVLCLLDDHSLLPPARFSPLAWRLFWAPVFDHPSPAPLPHPPVLARLTFDFLPAPLSPSHLRPPPGTLPLILPLLVSQRSRRARAKLASSSSSPSASAPPLPLHHAHSLSYSHPCSLSSLLPLSPSAAPLGFSQSLPHSRPSRPSSAPTALDLLPHHYSLSPPATTCSPVRLSIHPSPSSATPSEYDDDDDDDSDQAYPSGTDSEPSSSPQLPPQGSPREALSKRRSCDQIKIQLDELEKSLFELSPKRIEVKSILGSPGCGNGDPMTKHRFERVHNYLGSHPLPLNPRAHPGPTPSNA